MASKRKSAQSVTPSQTFTELINTLPGESLVTAAFEQNSLGIVVVDTDAKIVRANASYCRITGYSPEELAGLHIQDITHPEDRQKSAWLKRREADLQLPARFEKRYLRKDGQIIWVNILANVITDSHGKPVCGIAVVEETTPQKRMQAEVEEARADLSTTLDMSPGCLWSMDLDFTTQKSTFRYASPSMEELTGWSLDVMRADPKDFFERKLIHPQDQPFIEKAWREAAAAKDKAATVECRIICADGSIRWIRDILRITWLDKTHARVDGVILDITERIEQEERLRQSEARSRALAEAIPDAMFVFNSQGVVLACEPGRRAARGLIPNACAGKNLKELLPCEIAQRILDVTPLVLESYEPQSVEYACTNENRLRQDFECRIVPHGAQEVLAIVRDITARKRAVRELEQHNAILSAISASAQLLLQPTDWDAAIHKVITILGETLGVDRVHILENLHEKDKLYARVRYEWTAAGVPPIKNLPLLQRMPYPSAARNPFTQSLMDNQIVKWSARDFPLKTVFKSLDDSDIQSFIVLPIHLSASDFWGLLVFETSQTEHTWTPLEEDALKIALDMLTAALQRRKTENDLRTSEERYRILINLSPNAVIYADLEWRIILANPQAAALFGYGSCAEMAAKGVLDLVDAEERTHVLQSIRQLGAKKSLRNLECTCVREPGLRFPAEMDCSTVHDSQGNPLGYISIFQDISMRKISQSAFNGALNQLQTYVNLLKARNHVSALFSEMLHELQSCANPEDVYALTGKYMMSIFPGQSGVFYAYNFQCNILEAVQLWGETLPIELVFAPEDCQALKGKQPYLEMDGHPRPCCYHKPSDTYLCVPLIYQEDVLGVLHFQDDFQSPSSAWKQQMVSNLADSLALAINNIRLRQNLEYQSTHDYLTGLHNRRYLDVALEKELHRAARHQRPLSVLIFDLDQFKRTNELYGYKAGDELLRLLSIFLRKNIRSEDIACRYNTDEIALILTESPVQESLQRAENLCELVQKEEFNLGNTVIMSVSLTFGIAHYPQNGTTPEEIIKAAENALVRAKQKKQGAAETDTLKAA